MPETCRARNGLLSLTVSYWDAEVDVSRAAIRILPLLVYNYPLRNRSKVARPQTPFEINTAEVLVASA